MSASTVSVVVLVLGAALGALSAPTLHQVVEWAQDPELLSVSDGYVFAVTRALGSSHVHRFPVSSGEVVLDTTSFRQVRAMSTSTNGLVYIEVEDSDGEYYLHSSGVQGPFTRLLEAPLAVDGLGHFLDRRSRLFVVMRDKVLVNLGNQPTWLSIRDLPSHITQHGVTRSGSIYLVRGDGGVSFVSRKELEEQGEPVARTVNALTAVNGLVTLESDVVYFATEYGVRKVDATERLVKFFPDKAVKYIASDSHGYIYCFISGPGGGFVISPDDSVAQLTFDGDTGPLFTGALGHPIPGDVVYVTTSDSVVFRSTPHGRDMQLYRGLPNSQVIHAVGYSATAGPLVVAEDLLVLSPNNLTHMQMRGMRPGRKVLAVSGDVHMIASHHGIYRFFL